MVWTSEELPAEVKAKCLLLGIRLVQVPMTQWWTAFRVADSKFLRCELPGGRHAPTKQYYEKPDDALIGAIEMMVGHDEYWY